MPDYEALIRFGMVVEEGSFSAAARRLGISRQAVQRSVDGLEQEHGVHLIERTTRRLRLTDAGRRLLPLARAIADAGNEADALLHAAKTTPAGLLRISAPPLFAESVLSDVLPAFLQRWPDIHIEARFHTARTDPFEEDIDVIIRIGGAPPEHVYAVRLGLAAQVLCATPAYLEAHLPPAHPDELSRHELLAYGHGGGSWFFDGPEGAVGVEVRLRLQTNSAPVMVSACVAGLGILRVPKMAVTTQLAQGTLREVLPDWSITPAEVWAIYGHRTATDPTLLAFLDALRAASW